MSYVGRFAPSPTGPLHFGSLVAAVASYCDAKANAGKWLVRIEDLDKPREVIGAAHLIINTLEAFGFEWDGDIVFQSQRNNNYQEAFNQLSTHVYPCVCTRKEIADSSQAQGIDGLIYPQTCLLNPPLQANHSVAYRVIVLHESICFLDVVQGEIRQNLARDVGDFILKRKDGLFAYQLAVVVDDLLQGVTHVVRGADLLDSTPRQIFLQQLFGYPSPAYAHIPVACNKQGEKLSKQTLAKAITAQAATSLVFDALQFLGQQPPLEIKNATLNEVWRWAIDNWQLTKVPQCRQIVHLQH